MLSIENLENVENYKENKTMPHPRETHYCHLCVSLIEVYMDSIFIYIFVLILHLAFVMNVLFKTFSEISIIFFMTAFGKAVRIWVPVRCGWASFERSSVGLAYLDTTKGWKTTAGREPL